MGGATKIVRIADADAVVGKDIILHSPPEESLQLLTSGLLIRIPEDAEKYF